MTAENEARRLRNNSDYAEKVSVNHASCRPVQFGLSDSYGLETTTVPRSTNDRNLLYSSPFRAEWGSSDSHGSSKLTKSTSNIKIPFRSLTFYIFNKEFWNHVSSLLFSSSPDLLVSSPPTEPVWAKNKGAAKVGYQLPESQLAPFLLQSRICKATAKFTGVRWLQADKEVPVKK